MVKEAQPVCIHSSVSKRFEIASTRKREQVISTGVHIKKKGENKNPETPFFTFDTTAIFKILANTWSLNPSN